MYWGKSLNTPKMRQLKQFLICLQLFNSNSFFDGKKVEYAHLRGKTKLTKHNNHKEAFKKAVTKNDAKNLQLIYAIGGGHWGPNFEYCLGRKCLSLRDAKKPPQPNPAMIRFMLPRGITPKLKFYASQFFGDNKKEPGSRKKQNPLSFKSTKAINSISSHGYISELMMHINAASPDDAIKITWLELLAHDLWSLKKVSSFRFFNHHQSFSMKLTHNCKCIMKTNNNEIFKFKHAYKFKYNDECEILVAFGLLFPIHVSSNPNTWLNEKFTSMDYINIRERRSCWYFCTNFVEPVFLIHECVSFDSIRSTLPRGWRRKNSEAFYHNFAFNLYKLQLEKDEYVSVKVRKKIQLPCGPIFKCKKHCKSRCAECPVLNHFYEQSKWEMNWKCNKTRSSRFRIFDSKNGLNMTLMKTVTEAHDFVY